MTHTFNIDKGSIRLVASHNGKQYKKATGLTIDPSLWNKDAKSLPAKCKDRKVWEKLRLIHIRAEEKQEEAVTEQDVLRVMEYAISGEYAPENGSKTARKQGYMEYFKEWSERPSTSIRQRRLAYNNILDIMGDVSWDEVDESYCYRLILKMQEKEWGINYQGNMIKAVKVVMSEGLKLGYHSNRSFQDFKAPHSEVDNIYLTEEEMQRLWDAKIKSSLKSKSRDLAWLGYLTCARFSDYSRLSEDNIGTDGKIRFSQQKTSKAVVLPCSPKVREILERNGGKAPVLSHQKFNQYIKELCKDCGINDKIEVVSIKGTAREHSVCEKWELVTSHTFRRSAATNLYLKGVPLRSIMQLTGHGSIAMLEKYLKVGGEENADRLSGIEFFK